MLHKYNGVSPKIIANIVADFITLSIVFVLPFGVMVFVVDVKCYVVKIISNAKLKLQHAYKWSIETIIFSH